MNNMRKLINLMENVSVVPGIGNEANIDEAREPMYHSVFVQLDNGSWIHETDADDAEDARLAADYQKRQGHKTVIIRVPQSQADWRVVDVNKFVGDYLATRAAKKASSANPPGQLGETSETELGVGAKVFPRWSQSGEPFEIVGMTQSGKWVCVDDYGNRGSMSGEDLVLAPQVAEEIEKPPHVDSCVQSNSAAARDACAMEESLSDYDTNFITSAVKNGITFARNSNDLYNIVSKETGYPNTPEFQALINNAVNDYFGSNRPVDTDQGITGDEDQMLGLTHDEGPGNYSMEEDINNGYDEVHYANGVDYFPNGADGPVVKAVGPSGARHGDNPEQKKMQVAETHKELVYAYRKYLNESATSETPKKKLRENQQPVISNVEVQDYAGDFDHDDEHVTYQGSVSLAANVLDRNGQVLGIGYTIEASVKAPYNWESDDRPTGYNYGNDSINYTSSSYASVGRPEFESISLSTEEPIITDSGDLSIQDAQQVLDPNVFRAVLDPQLYQAFFSKYMDAHAEKITPPEPDFDEQPRDDFDDRY